MADISKITLPNGQTYDIKDAVARATQVGGMHFIGVTTTNITDGSTTATVSIGGNNHTAAAGDIVLKDNKEFVFGADSKWHEFGDMSGLGTLATKNSASGTYTPAGTISQPIFTGSPMAISMSIATSATGNYTPEGTVSQPTFSGSSMTSTGTFTPNGTVTVSTSATSNKTATVSAAASGTTTYTPGGTVGTPTISVNAAGTTTTIKNPTKVTVAKTVTASNPGTSSLTNEVTYYTYDSATETLSLKRLAYTTGDSITTSDVTVKTGDASYVSSQPTWTGTAVRLVTGNIPVPNTYTASFTGTEGSVEVSGTPAGTVSQPSFSGTKVKISGMAESHGDVSIPTFTGTQATITVS